METYLSQEEAHNNFSDEFRSEVSITYLWFFSFDTQGGKWSTAFFSDV